MNWGIPGRSRAMDHDPIGLNWIYDVFVDDLSANASRLSRAKPALANAARRGPDHTLAAKVRRWLWAEEVPCVIGGESARIPTPDVMLLYGLLSNAAGQARAN